MGLISVTVPFYSAERKFDDKLLTCVMILTQELWKKYVDFVQFRQSKEKHLFYSLILQCQVKISIFRAILGRNCFAYMYVVS